MKAFFEEYGLIIVVAIVIGICIMIATPIGESIRDAIVNIVESFMNKTTEIIGDMGIN